MGPYIFSIFLLIYFQQDATLHSLFISVKLLYTLRMVSPPIIRSTHNCICSILYLLNRYCYLPLLWNWFECGVGIVLIFFLCGCGSNRTKTDHVREILTFPSNCAEDNFWSKWRFLWQSVSLEDSRINVLDCVFRRRRPPPPPHEQLHIVFSRPSPFDCVSVAVIEGHPTACRKMINW